MCIQLTKQTDMNCSQSADGNNQQAEINRTTTIYSSHRASILLFYIHLDISLRLSQSSIPLEILEVERELTHEENETMQLVAISSEYMG